MVYLAIAGVWIVSGLVGSGLMYAYFQREFSVLADDFRKGDRNFAIIVGLFGPIGLVDILIGGYFRHGWLIPGAKVNS